MHTAARVFRNVARGPPGAPQLWPRTTRRYDRSVSHPAIRYARTIDGLHIAYQVVGEGPVDLVYAPGWFSNLEAVWDVPDLADFLGELASAFRLILLDRRGFGLSDWPITSGSLSLELGMDDIRAVMSFSLGRDGLLSWPRRPLRGGRWSC